MRKTVFCLALALLLAAHAESAPAPLAKRPPRSFRESLVGKWELVWGGYTYQADMNADGSFVSRWHGKPYFGFWRVEGDEFVFVESMTPADADSFRLYSVKLDNFRGRVVRGSPGIEVVLRRR